MSESLPVPAGEVETTDYEARLVERIEAIEHFKKIIMRENLYQNQQDLDGYKGKLHSFFEPELAPLGFYHAQEFAGRPQGYDPPHALQVAALADSLSRIFNGTEQSAKTVQGFSRIILEQDSATTRKALELLLHDDDFGVHEATDAHRSQLVFSRINHLDGPEET